MSNKPSFEGMSVIYTQAELADSCPGNSGIVRVEEMPKVGAFAWLTLKPRILTDDRRVKYGFVGPSQCILFLREMETMNHLLVQCEFSQNVGCV